MVRKARKVPLKPLTVIKRTPPQPTPRRVLTRLVNKMSAAASAAPASKRIITTRKPAQVSTITKTKPTLSKSAKVAIKAATAATVSISKTVATKKAAAKAKPTPKKFEKIGQRYAAPVKTDPLYRFYMTLLDKRPDSKMAMKWCIEHGTLSDKEAAEAILTIEMQEKAKIVDGAAVAPPTSLVKRRPITIKKPAM